MRSLLSMLLTAGACTTTAQPSQHITLPASTAPGPWSVMREALDDCARSYGLAGELVVRVTLDHFGKVVAVDSDYGSSFAGCVGRSLLRSAYRDHADQVLELELSPART